LLVYENVHLPEDCRLRKGPLEPCRTGTGLTLLGALLLVIALILYGCLYPFRFHPLPADPWTTFWSSWPVALTRSAARDGLVNVVLYVPLGLFAFLAFERIRGFWLRFLATLVLALVLSTGIEFLQLMDWGRTSSACDVLCNIAGAALGAAIGRFYAAWISRVILSTHHSLAGAPSASLLLCLWFGYALFPLFPSLSVYSAQLELRHLLAGLTFSPYDTIFAFTEWLAVAALLRRILGQPKVRVWMSVLLLLLPARLVFFHRPPTLGEFCGAVLAFLCWNWWLWRWSRPAVLLSCLLVAGIVIQELMPFRFNHQPQPFSWMPFAAFINTAPDSGAVIFFRKGFWYGGAVWALHESGCAFLGSALALALLLGLLEFAQRYLPGRTPEISDSLIVLVLSLLMWLLERRPSPPVFPRY
jgi:VanZ family protein